MDKLFNAYYHSPIGIIHVQADKDALLLTSFIDDSDNEIGIINNIFIFMMSFSVIVSFGIHILGEVEEK
jgi:hypothetical protein